MSDLNTLPPLREDLRESFARVRSLDWLMLVLALLSMGLVGWALLLRPNPELLLWLFVADYIICAAFAAQFMFRWSRTGFARGWLARNWYELLGMIPLQPTIARGYWFAVLRIFILLARFGIALNRAFGQEFTHRLILRARNAVVESIAGALTVAVLDRVSEVLSRGTYTRNVSRALEDNQEELRAMIGEKLREDRAAGRLSRLPFYEDIISAMIDTCMRVVEQVLRDPRTDRLVADMLRENLTQIRSAVEAEEQAAEDARHAAPDPMQR